MANVMINVTWNKGHVTHPRVRGKIGKGGACSKPEPACLPEGWTLPSMGRLQPQGHTVLLGVGHRPRVPTT